MMLHEKILTFYRLLSIGTDLPKGVSCLNPYLDPYTVELCTKFYKKFYNDNSPRRLILGINPGRFGSGTTGISFVDPVILEKDYGIKNTFKKKGELSSDFIHRVIQAYGGPEKFYGHYFISAVSPLGFTKDGKNINYYDDNRLEAAILPFIINSLQQILNFGIERDVCFCVGGGKNYEFLKKLNVKYGWFMEIIPLPHPRFIMQYRRKKVDLFIHEYIQRLKTSSVQKNIMN